MIRRRQAEIFSLSFLDCICCGFGAIILIFVLSIGARDKEKLETLLAVQRSLAEHAAAVRIRDRDAPVLVAENVRNAVVPGHTLVRERVVRREQLQHRTVFAHEAVEEELGLTFERRSQRGVICRIEQRVGMNLVEILETEPLPRESLGQTDRSRIGMVFAKEPPRQQIAIAALQNANFTLPAGAVNFATLMPMRAIPFKRLGQPEDVAGTVAWLLSPDARGKLTSRHSPTVFNAMGQPSIRWLGDRPNGADQAEGSMTGSMGFPSKQAGVERLRELKYLEAFRAAYPQDPEPMSARNYGRAIAAYQATLVTPAPFDRFLAGDDAALTDRQKAGLRSFIDYGCGGCHSGPLLGGASLQRFGVTKEYWLETKSEKIDEGRFAFLHGRRATIYGADLAAQGFIRRWASSVTVAVGDRLVGVRLHRVRATRPTSESWVSCFRRSLDRVRTRAKPTHIVSYRSPRHLLPVSIGLRARSKGHRGRSPGHRCLCQHRWRVTQRQDGSCRRRFRCSSPRLCATASNNQMAYAGAAQKCRRYSARSWTCPETARY